MKKLKVMVIKKLLDQFKLHLYFVVFGGDKKEEVVSVASKKDEKKKIMLLKKERLREKIDIFNVKYENLQLFYFLGYKTSLTIQ